jgi:uncharacterized protein involved in exopolysaccharide biosynthesis
MDSTLELGRLGRRVWNHRLGIGALVGVAIVVTAGISLLLPPWYRATGSLLPPAEEETGFGIGRLLKSGVVPGLKVPTESMPADVYLAILGSRRINEAIVRRFDLQRRYKTRYMEAAIWELQQHVKFKLTDAGLIEIAVEDRSAQQAADMLNAYMEELDRFNREARTTKGRQTRVFVEGRLAENRRDLAQAEDRLAQYQASHKAAVLSPETSTAVEQAARLYAQRTALLVRLGVVRSYSHGTDEEAQINEQLAQLDRQLAALPATGLELARLVREVKTYEALYALLMSQYEEARIEEARDVPSVDVLDPAVPPQRKSRPARTLMVAGAFLLSLAVGVAYALLQPDLEPQLRQRATASSA